MNKNKFYSLLIIISICSGVTGCDWKDLVKDKFKIEHVFSIPSAAYGPGTLLLYTPESGYTKTCWPWDTTGSSKEEYQKNHIISNPIIDANISKGDELEFNINLNVEDKAKIDSNYHNITGLKLSLTNGKQSDLTDNPDTIINRISDHDHTCYKSAQERLKSNNSGKFYISYVNYGYDFQYSVKINSKWDSTAKLPKEVLKVLAAKINIKLENNEETEFSGKNVYIGFNGDSVVIKKSKQFISESLTGGKKVKLHDVTDLFK